MRAAVLREVNRPLTIEEVQVDSPAPREVLVRTRATGVCHSDLHFIEGKQTWQMPVILGHEAAGTVEAVGDQVSYVRPGDRVITCLSVFCGHCDQCVSGRPNLCDRAGVVRSPDDPPRLRQGDSRIHQFTNISSFAEQMLVHEHSVVKITQDIPFEQLALIGCGVTTGVGAVLNTARVEPGSTVAVIGCGGVGLNCVRGAALAGALRTIAIDAVETKLGMARDLGATDVVDASSGDVVEKVVALTGGGVDYSFEAIGTKETAEQAFEMLAKGGTATIDRDYTRGYEDRAGCKDTFGRAKGPGEQHGLQPVSKGHAAIRRVLPAGPSEARRTGIPAAQAGPDQRGLRGFEGGPPGTKCHNLR